MKVLHLELRGKGGIESLLYNVTQNIDSKRYEFSFISTSRDETLEKNFRALGVELFHFDRDGFLSYFIYFVKLRKLVKNNNYRIIHIHKNSLANILPILICKIFSDSKIIIHSHNILPARGKISKKMHYFNKRIIDNMSVLGLACSESASNWMFDEKFRKKNNVIVFRNGINIENFSFDIDKRSNVRKGLSLDEDTFVVGNVGRLMFQKNHKFLVDIFSEIKQIYPKSKMIICGEGELKDDIEKYIQKKGCENEIILFGNRSDVNELMQAMDIFVLPSNYESAAVVTIEAQTAGLPVIMSDRVAKETIILDETKQLPLDLPAKEWAQIILSTYKLYERKKTDEIVRKAGYDMKENVKYLEEIYKSYSRDEVL